MKWLADQMIMDSMRRVEHIEVGDVEMCSMCRRVEGPSGASLTCFVCDGINAFCPLNRSICEDCAYLCGLDVSVQFFVCDVCKFRQLVGPMQGATKSSLIKIARDSMTTKAKTFRVTNPRIAQLRAEPDTQEALRVLSYIEKRDNLEQWVPLDTSALSSLE